MNDPEVLALAAERQRVLFHMMSAPCQLTSVLSRSAGRQSSNVFLIPPSLDVGTAIEELLLVWFVSQASDRENQLQWLLLRSN